MSRFISKKGDIFGQDVDMLVNPVNCVGVAGRGLAEGFRRRYPLNYQVYRETCLRGELRPGNVLITHVTGDPTLYIANLPTKDHWCFLSRYSWVEAGLIDLARELERLTDVRSIAVPALGCGLGRLDWSKVRELIEKALRPLVDAGRLEVRLLEPGTFLQPGEE